MATRCPRCFYLIGAEPRTSFECTRCDQQVDAIASAYDGGNPVRLGPVITTSPASSAPEQRPLGARCSRCGSTASREVCPFCHYRLPRGWRDTETTCIAMAGARASGKSFYIAVAVRELQEYWQENGRPFLFGSDETGDTYLERYQRPLYEERRLIVATPPARLSAPERTPMIFNIGGPDGRTHNLVVRDVAGEDLERGDLDPHTFAFFANSDGILFLFDPMGVEQIRAMLARLVPDETRVGGDPRVVLSSLGRQLGQHRPLPSNVPIAVVLSKFDVMQQLREVRDSQWRTIMQQQGAAFLRDPHYRTAGYNDADGRLLDAEVRSLLELLGGQGLLAQTSQLSRVTRYFAVSSLGQHTRGERIHDRGISPFRCLEPVKWLLARRGVIPGINPS